MVLLCFHFFSWAFLHFSIPIAVKRSLDIKERTLNQIVGYIIYVYWPLLVGCLHSCVQENQSNPLKWFLNGNKWVQMSAGVPKNPVRNIYPPNISGCTTEEHPHWSLNIFHTIKHGHDGLFLSLFLFYRWINLAQTHPNPFLAVP